MASVNDRNGGAPAPASQYHVTATPEGRASVCCSVATAQPGEPQDDHGAGRRPYGDPPAEPWVPEPIEARAEDGLIVAGHRRYLASQKLGLTHAPTILHEGMSDDEAAAYTIAHTQAEKSGPEWNRALLSDQVAGLPEDLLPGLGFDEGIRWPV